MRVPGYTRCVEQGGRGPSPFRRLRRAFTIVELLVVIAIIGILLGIVTTAATASVRNGRTRRAEALGRALEQAISAYYAQEGKWPDAIESRTSSMGNRVEYTFSATEADQIFRDVVRKSVGSSVSRPLVDASALFVANAGRVRGDGCFDNHSDRNCTSYCGDQHCVNGVDFSLASKRDSKVHVPLNSMAFGWQGRTNGRFCRYWITYNSQTDSVSVSRRNPDRTYPNDWE